MVLFIPFLFYHSGEVVGYHVVGACAGCMGACNNGNIYLWILINLIVKKNFTHRIVIHLSIVPLQKIAIHMLIKLQIQKSDNCFFSHLSIKFEAFKV